MFNSGDEQLNLYQKSEGGSREKGYQGKALLQISLCIFDCPFQYAGYSNMEEEDVRIRWKGTGRELFLQ